MSPLSEMMKDISSLRAKIRKYQDMAKNLQDVLSREPSEWGKYQSLFNYHINGIFREIMEYEKNSLKQGREDKVYKLKRLFITRLRKEFLHGDFIVWSFEKPYGYAGDYKIIEDIYQNEPRTTGFERLYDNYFQMSSISVAVRNRKEDFRRYLINLLASRKGKKVRIMNIGSGPARELFELFSALHEDDLGNLTVDCLDNDSRSLDYARRLLFKRTEVNFMKENAVRLALKKDITQAIPCTYDCIYSTGLFDYFDDRITVRLLGNLRALLNPEGQIMISDVRDKYSNPSVHFMEWVGDWNLIYREDERFRQLFIDAGFPKNAMRIGYEQQGILQYITATRP